MHKLLSRFAVPSLHSSCCCMTVHLSWWAYQASELYSDCQNRPSYRELLRPAYLAIREDMHFMNE